MSTIIIASVLGLCVVGASALTTWGICREVNKSIAAHNEKLHTYEERSATERAASAAEYADIVKQLEHQERQITVIAENLGDLLKTLSELPSEYSIRMQANERLRAALQQVKESFQTEGQR